MRHFVAQREAAPVPAGAEVLRAGVNLFTGESDLETAFGPPTSLESDLLLLASSILAADRATARGEREDISREFRLTVPIVNIGCLMPVIDLVEEALNRLSNDAWTVEFVHVGGEPETAAPVTPRAGKTLLFSGGLDSLAAAIEFGAEPGSLQLVSHKTRNRYTDASQRELVSRLVELGYTSPHRQCFVSSRSGGPTELDHDEENSQRTRSFVFLVLGGLMARRSGHRELLYLAENGQMAIHLPLTHGRVGAFSTHTAHPDVLLSMEAFLSQVFGDEFHIVNPYVHRTKKEVVEVVFNAAPQLLPISNSCWKNSRLPASATHCGACVPCYVRRIAIESFTADETAYHRDPWSEEVAAMASDDDARRNLVDLCELVKRIELSTDEDMLSEWPELYAESIDEGQVIAMYRRFCAEARAVLAGYPGLAPLLL